jgi:predicted metalloprotease
MRWQRGTSDADIEDRRAAGGRGTGRGGLKLGLGGVIVLGLLSVVFKQNFFTLLDQVPTDSSPTTSSTPATASPEESERFEFVKFVLNDAQDTWSKLLPAEGRSYQRATLVVFRDAVDSACGSAEAATGPFYCPGDQKVYIDLSFYDDLKQQFGAAGDFAQAYVIAHELGHHVQNLMGIDEQVARARQRNPSVANALSVRQELQADCFAGIWGHSTQQRNLLEQGDIEEGLNAAAAIGDDRIQRMSGNRVAPEKFTHGSSAQRLQWFKRGLESGEYGACDTFK